MWTVTEKPSHNVWLEKLEEYRFEKPNLKQNISTPNDRIKHQS